MVPRVPANSTGEAEMSLQYYWYEAQERAFAPGIVKEWPPVILHPTDRNGRLVRHSGNWRDVLKEMRDLPFFHDGLSGDLIEIKDKAHAYQLGYLEALSELERRMS